MRFGRRKRWRGDAIYLYLKVENKYEGRADIKINNKTWPQWF
jgi:hypothetical protein